MFTRPFHGRSFCHAARLPAATTIANYYQSFHRDDSVMIAAFFSIPIASSHRGRHIGEKCIKSHLCATDGFKSQRPSYSIHFLSPPGIIPARSGDHLDFVLHDLFKA
jgi:hypothetical protein